MKLNNQRFNFSINFRQKHGNCMNRIFHSKNTRYPCHKQYHLVERQGKYRVVYYKYLLLKELKKSNGLINSIKEALYPMNDFEGQDIHSFLSGVSEFSG